MIVEIFGKNLVHALIGGKDSGRSRGDVDFDGLEMRRLHSPKLVQQNAFAHLIHT